MSRRSRPWLAGLAIAFAGCGVAEPDRSGSAPAPAATPAVSAVDLRRHLSTTERRGLLVGPDGWIFLAEEADFLSDPATGEPPPIPEDRARAIVEFDRELARAGIELVFMPVPAKLAIYPEHLLGLPLAATPARLDEHAAAYLRSLRDEGVRVLDLADEFLRMRSEAEDPLHLPTDSHWSPRGCLIAARTLAREILQRLGREPHGALVPLRTTWIDRVGDLTPYLPRRHFPPDRVRLLSVPEGARDPGAGRDVLLVGDSNLVVFRDQRSGLAELLERELSAPVDVVAMQAGGATGARKALARKPRLLAGRRFVVWVVASRLLVTGEEWTPVHIATERISGSASSEISVGPPWPGGSPTTVPSAGSSGRALPPR